MNTSDVQVYSYVTEQGRRISVSMGLFGEIDKDRKVDVSITVDDVERLHSSTHWHIPPGVPLGEWLINGVVGCLCEHMEAYTRFQLLENLLAMANVDDMKFIPIDDRHIAELTDAQAEWWNEDDNHPLVDYLFDQIKPAVNAILEQFPQLRANREHN